MTRAILLLLTALALIGTSFGASGQAVVFGPQSYVLTAGRPQQFSERFVLDPAACNGLAVFLLVVEHQNVSSATIHLNGAVVASEKDFPSGGAPLEVPVSVAAQNVLQIDLKGGRPGAVLAVSIRRELEEQFAPDVVYTLSTGSEVFRRAVSAAPGSSYLLVVTNGDGRGGGRVATGTISIGGRVVVDQNDLARAATIRKTVTLASQNDLVLDLRGNRGATLTLGVKRRLDESACGPRIKFTAPAQNADIVSSTIAAAGTVTGPRGVGVTVNGLPAEIELTHAGTDEDPFLWFADVPAVAGQVTLTATATAPSGATAEAARDVLLLPHPTAVQLESFPRSGPAPLPVRLHVAPPNPAEVVRYEVDFDGDGVNEIAAAELPSDVSFTYSAAGHFRVTLRCVLQNGSTSVASTHVLVHPFDAVDAMLRSSWSRFSTALAARDMEKALRELSPSAREKYEPALRTIGSALPAYVASISGFDPVWIHDRAAHYLLRRTIDGRTLGYHVYFTRGGDGVWRLTQF